jgi:hypothetical protein
VGVEDWSYLECGMVDLTAAGILHGKKMYMLNL